ncbi:MAG: Tn3 family transposase, partial [Ktedonobacteraceae bacterium]|nr:Tn3 family transposase [Ktedonobacteraceae bacterium]
MVDLLLQLIHRIDARAEKRVKKELIGELQHVENKPRLLYQVAEAAVANPDETIRKGIFRVMSEAQCKAIIEEYKTKGGYHQQVYVRMRSSYRDHYRRMVPLLVNMLEVRSSNSVHQPVVRALDLIKRYAGTAGIWYPVEEDVPIDGVIRPMWQQIVLEKDKQGEQRINRVNYELCVLEALRDGLRCRELWVVGANKYRNPDDDLPKDFVERREEYYKALAQPEEAQDFVETVQRQMRAALESFDRALPKLAPKVRLSDKQGEWIHLSPLEAQKEPQNLRRMKAEIVRHWGMTNLLDVLKEADLRIGFTHKHFKSVAVREVLDRETLQKRLLLCLYGLGTNTGIKRVSMGDHGQSYQQLLYTRRRYLHQEHLRAAIVDVANAIFQVRQP